MSTVHEVLSNSELPHHHPLSRVNQALRIWLALTAVMMFWNAGISNAILLTGALRPVPFALLGLVALYWMAFPWSGRVTIWCAALLCVGLWLRAAEVLVFGDVRYDIRTRATGTSIWILVGGTALVFGFLNLVAISRRAADVQVWVRR